MHQACLSLLLKIKHGVLFFNKDRADRTDFECRILIQILEIQDGCKSAANDKDGKHPNQNPPDIPLELAYSHVLPLYIVWQLRRVYTRPPAIDFPQLNSLIIPRVMFHACIIAQLDPESIIPRPFESLHNKVFCLHRSQSHENFDYRFRVTRHSVLLRLRCILLVLSNFLIILFIDLLNLGLKSLLAFLELP